MATETTTDNTMFCSVESRRSGEAVHGSATSADVWLVLEYTQAWGRKAFEESDLPQAVKDHLDGALKAIPGSRIQLISQEGSKDRPGIRFFVAVGHDTSPHLYAFTLGSYEDLLSLDIPAIAAGSPDYTAHLSSERLFLVCTNGRRDACCAKFGLAAYAALAEHGGSSAWQTSHIGGHRFAPNLVCLPHGLSYGRVDPDRAADLIEDYRHNRVTVDLLRGRSAYAAPAQSAEVFLREETGILGADAFLLSTCSENGDARWVCNFEASDGTASYSVEIRQEATRELFASCGDASPKPVKSYHLVSLTEQ